MALKKTPAPEPGLPVERIAVVAAIGLAAVLFLWGAAKLLTPKPKPAPVPVAEPAPAPPPPPAEEEEAPSVPPIVFPSAPSLAAPATESARVPRVGEPLIENGDGTATGSVVPPEQPKR